MTNSDNYTNENETEHYSNEPYIPDRPYRIHIAGDSGSGKTNALLNLINNQLDIDKIYIYAKDPYEAKYQYLINNREKVGLNHYDYFRAFIEYLSYMQEIADMINNKKLNPIVTELFVKGRKLNISIVFITQSYFKVPKDVRINSIHIFIMKISNKR